MVEFIKRMSGTKFTSKLRNLMMRAKCFAYRLAARNLKNGILHLYMCLLPIGWVTALFSGLQLFGTKGNKVLLNPLWMITLSSLIIRRRNSRLLLCTSLFSKVKFFANDWDCIYIFYHIWICRDYERFVKPKERAIIVDCGAHIGLFTLKCLKNFNATLVVSVEPNPYNVPLLFSNLLMNKVGDKFLIIEAAAELRVAKENYICMV